MQTIHSLNQATRLLQTVLANLRSTANLVTKTLRPHLYHHGLFSLPPELLQEISLLVRDATPTRIPQLQFVCRQLRDFESAIPSLWTHVSDTMSPERIALQLKRSATNSSPPPANMSFSIRQRYNREDTSIFTCKCAQLSLIAKNAVRWSRGNIDLDCPIDHGHGGNANPKAHNCAMQSFMLVSFPALHTLGLSHVDHCSCTNRIYKSLYLPSLRNLSAYGVDALLAISNARILNSLDIRFALDRGLSAALSHKSYSSLTRLRITAFCDPDPPFTGHIVFPVLNVFSLALEGRVYADPWVQLLRCIKMPAVKTIDLKCPKGFAMSSSFEEWLSKSPEEYTSLHVLNIDPFESYDPYESASDDEYTEDFVCSSLSDWFYSRFKPTQTHPHIQFVVLL